jgi:hypothetical protein
MIRNYLPQNKGPIFDIGGGNGCVAKAIMDAGWHIILVDNILGHKIITMIGNFLKIKYLISTQMEF